MTEKMIRASGNDWEIYQIDDNTQSYLEVRGCGASFQHFRMLERTHPTRAIIELPEDFVSQLEAKQLLEKNPRWIDFTRIWYATLHIVQHMAKHPTRLYALKDFYWVREDETYIERVLYELEHRNIIAKVDDEHWRWRL